MEKLSPMIKIIILLVLVVVFVILLMIPDNRYSKEANMPTNQQEKKEEVKLDEKKIEELLSTKELIAQNITKLLEEGMAKTKEVYTKEQLLTGVDAIPKSTNAILKLGMQEYKVLYTKNSVPNTKFSEEYIPPKTEAILDSGIKKQLYPLDIETYQEKTKHTLPALETNSLWYLDAETLEVYLIFDNQATYSKGLVDANGLLSVNIADSVGKLAKNKNTNEKVIN